MKIKVSAEMLDRWSNSPEFKVKIDEEYTYPIYGWENRGGVHRCDRENGMVHYFYSNGKPTHGFSGATFEGFFKDLTPFKYQGAWSSSPGVVNKHYPEDPIVGVGVADTRYNCLAGAIRMEALVRAIYAQHGVQFGLALVDVFGDGGVTLEPTYLRDGVAVVKDRGLTPNTRVIGTWVPTADANVDDVWREIFVAFTKNTR